MNLRSGTTRRANLLAVMASVSLTFAAVAGAQAGAQAGASLPSLLPDTTIASLHAAPGAFDLQVLERVLARVDVEPARDVLADLADLLSQVMGQSGEGEAAPLSGLHEECPNMSDALEAALVTDASLSLGISVSRFAPAPAALLVARPGADGDAARLVAEATSCLDGVVIGDQGGVDLVVLGDGGDMPLVVAHVDGVLVMATDPEAARGAVRRAQGEEEPRFATGRLGRVAAASLERGVTFTLDLAALADFVEPFGAMAGDATALFAKAMSTLRVFGGVVVTASLDEAGLLVESVLVHDVAMAAMAGEDELVELLTCSACGAPSLAVVPRGAVTLRSGPLPLRALAAWVDDWVAAAAEAGALGEEDVADYGEVRRHLDESLLSWLGDTYTLATLDVFATDVRHYLQGLPTVLSVPVSSEDDAWRGIESWVAALEELGSLSAGVPAITDEMPEELGRLEHLRLDHAVSVRESTYRGVRYLRVRSGPTMDVALGVVAGHLVIASPAVAFSDAVDATVSAGGVPSRTWRTYEALAGTWEGVQGFGLVDASAVLTGWAEVADLAAGSVATGLWLAAVGAVGEDGVPETDVPTFDDMLALVDTLTSALLELAAATDVAIGTTEVVDGMRWSTWRLPLR